MKIVLLKKALICYLLVFSSGAYASIWGASNLFECLLDELPGVKNDIAATEIFRSCKKDFPVSPALIKKREPLFGVKTAGECVVQYAKDVTSPKGAKWIRVSCYKLYKKD